MRSDFNLSNSYSDNILIFMGKTRLHKDVGKFKNNVLDYEELNFGTKKHYDRYNFDKAEFAVARNYKREQIQKRELLNQIN